MSARRIFKEESRLSICSDMLRRMSAEAWEDGGWQHASGETANCHLCVYFFLWALRASDDRPWHRKGHTWAVSLLASGSAMTMRCKAWSCTLIWSPPNKKTEMNTYWDNTDMVSQHFLLTSGGTGGSLTAFSEKVSGLCPTGCICSLG